MSRRKQKVVASFDTLEEAIRALVADLEPGAELWIHHEDCLIEKGLSEDACTCIPRRLSRGVAQA